MRLTIMVWEEKDRAVALRNRRDSVNNVRDGS